MLAVFASEKECRFGEVRGDDLSLPHKITHGGNAFFSLRRIEPAVVSEDGIDSQETSFGKKAAGTPQHGIDLALRVLVEPGDEVLMPDPSYVSYSPCVIFAGGKPVPVPTREEDHFRLSAEAVRAWAEKT